MFRDIYTSDVAMLTYLDLRKRYSKELMCEPISAMAAMHRKNTRMCYADSELPGFWMLLLERGCEVAICAPGHGITALHEAITIAKKRFSAMSAWIREDNHKSISIFQLCEFVEIGQSTRKYKGEDVNGVSFARALW